MASCGERNRVSELFLVANESHMVDILRGFHTGDLGDLTQGQFPHVSSCKSRLYRKRMTSLNTSATGSLVAVVGGKQSPDHFSVVPVCSMSTSCAV